MKIELVGLEHLQSERQTGGVIVARFRGGAQIGAEERGAEFRDQFFDRGRLIGEPFAEFPRRATAVADSVDEFVPLVHFCFFMSYERTDGKTHST